MGLRCGLTEACLLERVVYNPDSKGMREPTANENEGRNTRGLGGIYPVL